MKKIVGILLLVLGLTSCAALYGNEEQYKKGDWYLFAESGEVARIQQDKLALKKLETQPAQTGAADGVAQGYKGVVVNLSSYRRINIHLNGPEKKGYFLGPGQSEEDYLIPGRYLATAYYNDRLVGSWSFGVGAEQYSYMGRKVHWYVYWDR